MNHISRLRVSVLTPSALLLLIAACAEQPKHTVQHLGTPHAARAADCELTLVAPSDCWPGGKYYPEFETIGIVNVAAESDNATPGDADVKRELKPQACALGGELITLITSNEKHNRYGGKLSGRLMSFQVLARKAAVPEQKY